MVKENYHSEIDESNKSNKMKKRKSTFILNIKILILNINILKWILNFVSNNFFITFFIYKLQLMLWNVINKLWF